MTTSPATTDLARTEPAAAAKVESALSERIRIARVISVLFVVLVHVNPGVADQNFADHGYRLFEYVRGFVVDILAGGGLRLLCVVAGYLFVFSLAKRDFDTMIRRKFRSLIVPLFVWNTTFFLFLALASLFWAGYWDQKFGHLTLAGWLNGFFPLTDRSFNQPVSFFRDMFVCFLLTPALLPLVKRYPRLLLSALFAFALSGLDMGVLFVRADIVFFYAAGLAIGHFRPRIEAFDRYFWLAVPVVFAGGVIDVLAFRELEMNGTAIPFYIARIDVIAIVLIWWLAAMLRPTPIGRFIQSWEPYTFVVFCGHFIFTTLLWVPFKLGIGGYYHPLYPLFYFGAALACFPMALLFIKAGERLSPRLISFYTGGREN